jgi:N-acetylmuramoyl-L-alanine amidase
MMELARGAAGEPVRDVQARLHALGFRTEPDEAGRFDAGTEAAVREFQQRRHLIADGAVGANTWQELVEAGHSLGDRVLYLRYPSVRGDDVRALQATLNLLGFDAGKEDGIFGPKTDGAVREFQRNVGLPDDGIAGASTAVAFMRLRPDEGGVGFASVREREALRDLSPTQLTGAIIAIDPGHGGSDRGIIGPGGLHEADVAFELAQSLAAQLRARGAAPLLLRGRDDGPTPSERARCANDADAKLVVALHMNSAAEPSAEGTTAFYCGRPGWSSPSGQRLAELIQEELTGAGQLDGRTHPKWLPLLRETRMTAVHVEPCFITNPREEEALRDEGFRGRLATAIVLGIERFFSGQAEKDSRGEALGAASEVGGDPGRGGRGEPTSLAERR